LRGEFGADTFYYGRGAGPHPTGVAVVSDLMRVAREIRHSSTERVSPFAHSSLGQYKLVPVTSLESAYYLRFRVDDKPGIIAQLATALAAENVSIDAVLQLPNANWRNLPFVITVEPTTEAAVRAAVGRMAEMKFLVEPPLVMPIERALS
jgi:homoserine dehydrogenase